MQLIRQFSRLFLGKVILAGTNFLILLLLSHFVPTPAVGEYYFQIALLATIGLLASFGMDNSLFFFVRKKLLSFSDLLGIAFWIACIFAALTFILLLLFNLNIIRQPAYYICGCAFISGLFLQHILNANFATTGHNWKLQRTNIVINLAFIAWIWFAVIFDKELHVDFLLYGYAGIFFVINLLCLVIFYFAGAEQKITQPQLKKFRKVLAFGWLSHISNSLFFLGANIDIFFIKLLCNQQLTAYTQATKLFQMICSVAFLLYYPFMGKIIGLSHSEGITSLLKASRLMLATMLCLLIPIYVFCLYFLKYIFPTGTQDIFNLLVLLSIAIISTSTAYLYTSYFVATKKYRQNIISAVIFLSTVVLLCLVLIPQIGMYGGAVAYSTAILFSLLFDIMYVVKAGKARLTDAILIKKTDFQIFKSMF